MTTPIIVVPTYWKKGPLKAEDTIYDHPTDLLNPEETITKTLQSFSILNGVFDVLVIGAPTRPEIGKEVDNRILKLIQKLKLPYTTLYFGFKEFKRLNSYLTSKFPLEFSNVLSNEGYGNIRNLSIFIPHVLGRNISILIDDDELITEPNFVRIATEFIGKKLNGKILGLILGFYRNEDGSIFLDETKVPWWELVWNKTKIMNEAFQIIRDPDQNRLINTPFAFGGNMVIHRKCWTRVPFDPIITRGEDMDYLRNVKYFGFDAKLDRSLLITHVPPKSQTQYIDKFHQDIFRFLYVKMKLETLKINTQDYDPYPGYFLKQTEGKVLLTELLYFIFYNYKDLITIKNSEKIFKKLQNVPSVFKEAYTFATANYDSYISFQKKWEELISNLPSDMPFEVTEKV